MCQTNQYCKMNLKYLTMKPKKPYILFATVFLGFILSSIPIYSQEKENTKYFELENGLKVFLYNKKTLPLINFVFAFDLGTKDESEETNGLVHILEHCILFRGTEFHSGDKISKNIRKHGAYFNAYTGRDLSIFELNLPSEYADFALNNQKEILFNLKLTQKELDEEKEVILEEISQIEDDPIKYETSLVYQNLFKNHAYQKPVYGKREVIKSATVEQVEKFYKSYFSPSNCALAVVGDFQMEKMEKNIKEVFGNLKKGEIPLRKFEKASLPKKIIEIKKEMDVSTGYLTIGMLAPDFNHEEQYAIDLLTEILGRGINPMLNHPLIERRIFVNSITMHYGAHKYGGIVFINLTLNPRRINAAKRQIIQFLKKSRSLNYSKKDYHGEFQLYAIDYLESAKNKIKFNTHKSQEIGLVIAESLAKFMLMNEDPNRGNFLENINKITSSDLRKAAGKYLSKNAYVIVSIVPKKKS